MIRVIRSNLVSTENNPLYKKYFEIIRYSLNSERAVAPDTTEMDWWKLYKFSSEQAILGVVFKALEELNDERIDKQLLFRWLADVERIKVQNTQLNYCCVEVMDELRQAGLETCLLKGQGNSVMYPFPHYRAPGDVDLLIKNANRKEILLYLSKKKYSVLGVHYQHIEYEHNHILVELHLMPCTLNNPLYNRRLQKYLQLESEQIWTNRINLPNDVGSVTVPTNSYNIIYQLAHIQSHFFDEGIGFKQMTDYFCLLKFDGKRNKDNVEKKLKYLGLRKFAGAVMYIMKEVLGLDEQYLIVPVDERRGKTLLNEILKGGNFGHHSGLDQKNALKKYFQKTWRNMQLVKEYPAEALCEPFFRTWHFFWRLAH